MTRAKYLRDDDRRQPEEISSLLGAVVEHVKASVDIRHGELIDEWLAVVPDDWTFGTPVGVREGRLLVTVPDGATASLLRYQIGPLLAVIEERYGAGVVTDVRLRVERTRSTDTSRE
jgi:predicted nucleic acid-binding Zn ribbon protein